MSDNRFERHLVSTQWLADNLDAPDLRVLDCTTYLHYDTPDRVRVESGAANYAEGHIPGAVYVDLQGELSIAHSRLRFMLPGPEQFASVMSAKGVGTGTRAVLYSATTPQWATRIWWMLHAFGFDQAMVLDGGLAKWQREGRPISTEPGGYGSANFEPQPRPGAFVGRDAVLAALDDSRTTVLNALAPEQHDGSAERHYGRPGHITGSVNVPANALLDADSGAYLDEAALRERFARAGVGEGPVVHYCGGGIAASSTAFAMYLLGSDSVCIYDASLSEWASDPALPMSTGTG